MKLSLFTDDVINYIENPKESTKTILKLVSDHSKAAAYKVNTHKSITFVYTTVNRRGLKLNTQTMYISISENERLSTDLTKRI